LKEYDFVVIGSGSAMNFVGALIQDNPKVRIALIDKDEPGGICLTRGCIPSKLMLYPAELIRLVEGASELGVEFSIQSVDFGKVMSRMRTLIDRDMESIREGLSAASENIDYYHAAAEFVSPYTLRIDGGGDDDDDDGDGATTIKGTTIFLATGSRPIIPKIKGIDSVRYHTSDSIIRMGMKRLPESLAIIGGGYVAAEFGDFFSAMGSRVTIIGRNPQFLDDEEPEVSAAAKKVLGRHMTILTDHEVREVEQAGDGGGSDGVGEDAGKKKKKRLSAVERHSGRAVVLEADEILVAAGRGPVNDILHPERGGVKTTREGWLEVDEYFETSKKNVWAFGDADGKYPFRHVANYESEVVYQNAVLGKRVRADYHAVPHAIFTYPEVAGVGLGERAAIAQHGAKNVVIGFQRFEDTAKGEAMSVKDCFVKVILEGDSMRILGAHIFGPHASVLIQEIINLMYTSDQSALPVFRAMHIHPSLSEVIQRAFGSLMSPGEYHHVLAHNRVDE
jgi:mycothione reductase